jgi:hypothetical protein
MAIFLEQGVEVLGKVADGALGQLSKRIGHRHKR